MNCSSDCVVRLDGMGSSCDEGALILAATQHTLGDNPIFRINLPVCEHHQHKKKGRRAFADRGEMVTSAARGKWNCSVIRITPAAVGGGRVPRLLLPFFFLSFPFCRHPICVGTHFSRLVLQLAASPQTPSASITAVA